MQHISARRRAQRQLAISRVGLVVAFVGFAALAAALFYQGSIAPAPALDEPGALARSFAASPVVQMSLFGAVAFGYAYWVLDFTFGRTLDTLPRLRRAGSVLFGLAVLAAFAGLLAWNLALLHGVA